LGRCGLTEGSQGGSTRRGEPTPRAEVVGEKNYGENDLRKGMKQEHPHFLSKSVVYEAGPQRSKLIGRRRPTWPAQFEGQKRPVPMQEGKGENVSVSKATLASA